MLKKTCEIPVQSGFFHYYSCSLGLLKEMLVVERDEINNPDNIKILT